MSNSLTRTDYEALDQSVLDRFWVKVDRKDDESCWNWKATKSRCGYGIFMYRKRPRKAHRFSYYIRHGWLDPELVIDHLCRNRACVNPSHLEQVTHRNNIIRGVSIVAKHAHQTHCKQGHFLDPETTKRNPKGWRICALCNKENRDRSRRGYNMYFARLLADALDAMKTHPNPPRGLVERLEEESAKKWHWVG